MQMKSQRLLIGLVLFGTVAAVAGSCFWWTRPPQMGADAEVFRTVDALYTAVTARDEKLLQQCERRLGRLREAGKLPREAADYLDAIIATARQGRWQPAAERLYDFMIAQRRAAR
jgi:hypothetical protein